MTRITPNLKDVEDLSKPLDAIPHTATILAAEPKTSAKGNPMLEIDFEVQVTGGIPRNRKAWVVTSGKAAYKFEQLLRACKLNAQLESVRNGEDFESDDLVGATLLVEIEHELYRPDGATQDQTRDKIKGFLPA